MLRIESRNRNLNINDGEVMVTKKTAKRGSQKNSLVGNINRRKKAGTSRSKSNSTISPHSYEQMGLGWPKSKKKKTAKKKKR